MGDKSHKCPVCDKSVFSKTCSFEVCGVCGWTDDFYQELYPDEDCFANIMSLNEARNAYSKGEIIE